MVQSPSRQLGELLVERKVLSRDILEVVLAREAREGTPLSAILTQEGLVSEKDLLAAVAQQVGVTFIDLAVTTIRPDLEEFLPAPVAREHVAVAVGRHGQRLVVAMENPGNQDAINELAAVTGMEVEPALAARGELLAALDAVYGKDPAAPERAPRARP